MEKTKVVVVLISRLHGWPTIQQAMSQATVMWMSFFGPYLVMNTKTNTNKIEIQIQKKDKNKDKTQTAWMANYPTSHVAGNCECLF